MNHSHTGDHTGECSNCFAAVPKSRRYCGKCEPDDPRVVVVVVVCKASELLEEVKPCS